MPSAPKAHCSTPFCPGFREVGSKCRDCAAKEPPRPTASARGYSGRRWTSAKRTVKRRDPFCRCDEYRKPNDPEWRCCPNGCIKVTEVADHHPRSRRQLIEDGVRDPDDPKYLRGLSRSCHSRITNVFDGGGWARKDAGAR